MNDNTIDLDQTEEETLLTFEVSDEALEAAAGAMGSDPWRSLVALTGRGPGDCC